jgi:hypothetical protein
MSPFVCLFVFLAVVACYVPRNYRVAFPSGVASELPSYFLEGSESILAIPCWYWIRDSREGYGPAIVLPKEALARLPQEIPDWRGFEMIDVFGHEGSQAPSPCGVLLVTDTGNIFRIDHWLKSAKGLKGKSQAMWMNGKIASLGPVFKKDLLDLLNDGAADPAIAGKFFSFAHGQIVGTPEDLEEARVFVGALPATGDDQWRPVSDSLFP